MEEFASGNRKTIVFKGKVVNVKRGVDGACGRLDSFSRSGSD